LSRRIPADPQVIFSSTVARARIFAEVSSAEALVSGTVIEARLDESYERRDGGLLTGARSRQDLAAYRVSMTEQGFLGGSTPEDLALHFAVGPSLAVGVGELLEGRIAYVRYSAVELSR